MKQNHVKRDLRVYVLISFNDTYIKNKNFFFINPISTVKNKIVLHHWKLQLQLFHPQSILWFKTPDDGHTRLNNAEY